MDAWTKALQPVSAPDFIDKAFKESPEGVSFRQWQPLDGMLDGSYRAKMSSIMEVPARAVKLSWTLPTGACYLEVTCRPSGYAWFGCVTS